MYYERVIMLMVVGLLFIVLKGINGTNWFIGRVPPGRFEYPQNNGWMLPHKAAKLCEYDIQCGGFTFKGSKDIVRNYEIYFFHYIDVKAFAPKEVLYPHWTSYIICSRKFVMLNGIIPTQIEVGAVADDM